VPNEHHVCFVELTVAILGLAVAAVVAVALQVLA
jgi:hypothetical protein